MTEESVKVAVRVRPFNKRERAMSSVLIVEMSGNTTYLKDPENPNSEPRKFSFDYSYWSFDGCRERPDGYFEPDPSKSSRNYCDQKKVYDDVGAGVLANAWEGYNSTLFAYGQTGSGKSWSVVGYGVNKGIVPQFCENLYKEIEAHRSSEGANKSEYEVTFSMLEIYNERCRDLLTTKKAPLKIRQHPKKGFYAEGLTTAAVASYAEIERRMEEGTTNRTVASTNMNATSSRAHTVVGISFVQKFQNAAGEGTTKSAIINLVDLAGSERADSTGATGDRLKEGAAINQSLSALGNCIAALADRSQGKNVRVPFRDSVLTKLLKNALGGNSKTVMIAAISPADVNYEETLSTLRYADRAKQIKTKVSVNEDPTDKLIRELQEENDRLKKMLESGNVTIPSGDDGLEVEEGMSPEEIEELKKQLREELEAEMRQNMKEMEDMNKSFKEKLDASGHNELAEQLAQKHEKQKTTPYISNLNYDPQLNGRIFYFIEDDPLTIGNGKEETVSVVLKGPSIQPQHAMIEKLDNEIFLKVPSELASVTVNGEAVQGPHPLNNGDRLIFGTTQYYVFVDPRASNGIDVSQVTFEMAQEELTKANVVETTGGTDTKPDRQQLALQENVASMLPAVQQANAIAEELQKERKFELILTPPEGRGDLESNEMQVFVKVTELDSGMEWVWDRRKFLARKFKMEEMYQKFEEGEDWKLPENQDPFIEEPSFPVHIGSVRIWLIGLAHYVDNAQENAFNVVDYNGYTVGQLNVVLQPCDATGRPLTPEESMEVDEPHEMLGRDIHFLISLKSGRNLPARYTDLCCRYRLVPSDEFTETKVAPQPVTPVWNHQKQFSFCPMTAEVIHLLSSGAMAIELWGRQVRVPVPRPAGGMPPRRRLIARESMMQMTQGQLASGLAKASKERENPDKARSLFETMYLKKKVAKLEQRMKWLRTAVQVADQRHVHRVPVECLKGLLSAQTDNKAESCYELIVKGK